MEKIRPHGGYVKEYPLTAKVVKEDTLSEVQSPMSEVERWSLRHRTLNFEPRALIFTVSRPRTEHEMISLTVNSKAWFPSVASGLLLALAFPQPGWGLSAFVALVPLLLALEGAGSWREAFRWGYIFGWVFFGILLFWVAQVVWVGYFLLVPFISLYPGAFGALFWGIRRGTRLPLWLSAAVLWTGLELVRTVGFLGFSWGSVGYSLGFYPPLIQMASYTGVRGVTFWVLTVNGLLAEWGSGRPRFWVRGALAAALLILPYIYGQWTLARAQVGRRYVQVALVQGNIDQDVKWDPKFLAFSFSKYDSLTRSIGESVDLVIWPETAAPTFLLKREPYREWVAGISRDVGAPLLTGANDYEWLPGGEPRMFNSAILFDPIRGPVRKYHKMHLVPFGERMPLVELLPFLKDIQIGGGPGNFTPGDERVLFEVGPARLPTLICFEAAFARDVRRFVRDGANLLVNITNDAWFGPYSAPYQHAQMAVFRTVEHRISLARCANTGVSMLVDPYGRVLKATKIFQDAVVVGELPLREGETFYAKHGEWLAWMCVGWSVGLLMWARMRRDTQGGRYGGTGADFPRGHRGRAGAL